MYQHTLERYRPLIDDWDGFCESLAQPLPTCIWTNTLRTTPHTLTSWLNDEQKQPIPIPWYPGAFRFNTPFLSSQSLAYIAGLCHIQEEVSLLPVHLLDPRPGETVLDLCAAPGNKTAQIAVAMDNTGTVVANDRHGSRLNVLRTTASRLGLMNIITTAQDGAQFQAKIPSFDHVLVDAPCTCEGTSRKHPSVLKPAFIRQRPRLASLQQQILQRGVDLCKPGGRVVYATCTYAPEENEVVIARILEENGPGSVRLLPVVISALKSSDGLLSWQDTDFPEDLKHTLRLWPHQNDTGGFFVAVLEKSLHPNRAFKAF